MLYMGVLCSSGRVSQGYGLPKAHRLLVSPSREGWLILDRKPQNLSEIVAAGKCSHHELQSGKSREGVKRKGQTWISWDSSVSYGTLEPPLCGSCPSFLKPRLSSHLALAIFLPTFQWFLTFPDCPLFPDLIEATRYKIIWCSIPPVWCSIPPVCIWGTTGNHLG